VSDEKTVLGTVRSAPHSEPHVRPKQGPIHLVLVNDELRMEGEVAGPGQKRIAGVLAW
jgi:hypothetical protein